MTSALIIVFHLPAPNIPPCSIRTEQMEMNYIRKLSESKNDKTFNTSKPFEKIHLEIINNCTSVLFFND